MGAYELTSQEQTETKVENKKSVETALSCIKSKLHSSEWSGLSEMDWWMSDFRVWFLNRISH